MRNGDDPTYVNVAVNEDLKKLAKDQHTNNEGQWTEEKIALAGEHVITEYRCVKCTYKSDRRNAIRKHIEAVHKKIRRFTCDKCGHEFNQLGNLYTHIKKKHKA